MTHIAYSVSPPVTNDALNTLFSAAWPDHTEADFARELAHSLCYICAYAGDVLVGFVNVAWNSGVHGFILDTTTHADFQRQGIGTRLVQEAAHAARARGIVWLHVDYEPHLDDFYRACGFQHTRAGLLRLSE